MFNEHTFLLDVSKKPISVKPPVIVLGQGDHNAYTLNVQLFDNSQPLDVDGYTVWFEMLLPDKQTTYAQEAQTQSGNTAVIVIDEEKAAAVVGVTKVASIVVRDEQGALIASTDRFTVECLRSPRSGKPAESWISGIDETIAAMENATESANNAAQAADDATEQAEQAAQDITAQVAQQAQAFEQAQAARTTAFNTAQEQRSTAYQQAEQNRETQYQTAEQDRDERADDALETIIREIDEHAGKYIPLMASDKLGGAKLGGSVQTVEQALEIKLVDSASGESVTAESASYLNALTVHGKSVQDGTPTPDNPVPVQVVDGVNLFNSAPSYTKEFTGNSSDEYAAVNTVIPGVNVVLLAHSGETITFSADAVSSVSKEIYLYTNRPSVQRERFTLGSTPTRISITLTYGTNATFTLGSQDSKAATVTFSNVQIERSTTAHPYTPYGSIGLQIGETVTPIDLQGHVLASLPDGTRDELRVDSAGRVTLTKELDAYTITGNETVSGFTQLASVARGSLRIAGDKPHVNPGRTGGGYCSHAPYVFAYNESDEHMYVNPYANGKDIFIYAAAESAADLLAKYAGATVIYRRETPQIVELGTIDPPSIPDGSIIQISASLTPTIDCSWWTNKATPIPEALQAYADAYTPTLANTDASIAPIEQTTATTNHNVGELLMVDGTLYRVTVAIATGEQITSGTNVTPTTLAAVIAELSNN